MIKPCVCGHDEKDHDEDDQGECREICCCAGYTTKLVDSNFSWQYAAQARISELEHRMERCQFCRNWLAAEDCERDGHTPCTHPYGCECGYIPRTSVMCSVCNDVFGKDDKSVKWAAHDNASDPVSKP